MKNSITPIQRLNNTLKNEKSEIHSRIGLADNLRTVERYLQKEQGSVLTHRITLNLSTLTLSWLNMRGKKSEFTFQNTSDAEKWWMMTIEPRSVN